MVGTRSLEGSELLSLDKAVRAALEGDVSTMFDACGELADRCPVVAWEALGCAVFDTRQVLPTELRGHDGMTETAIVAAAVLEHACGLEVDPAPLFGILAATFGSGNLPPELPFSQAVLFAVMLEAGLLLLVDNPVDEWDALVGSLEVPVGVGTTHASGCDKRRVHRARERR